MEEKVRRVIPYNDYNESLRGGEDIIGTVIPTFGTTAFRHGWKLIEIYED